MNNIQVKAYQNKVEIKPKENNITILPHRNNMLLKETRMYWETEFFSPFQSDEYLREGK